MSTKCRECSSDLYAVGIIETIALVEVKHVYRSSYGTSWDTQDRIENERVLWCGNCRAELTQRQADYFRKELPDVDADS